MHIIRRTGGLAALAVIAVLTVSLGGSAQAATVAVAATPSHTPDSVTFDGTVRATAYFGPTIFVAGDFQNAIVHGKKYPRSRLAAIDATSGYLYAWVPSANGEVWALTADAATNTVYIGGAFSKVNGQPRRGLARLDFSGNLLGFNHSVTGTPTALSTGYGRVFVGGAFSAIDGVGRSNIAAFSLTTDALDPSWLATANGWVRSLVVSGSRLYVGGQFHNVNRVAGTARLAALNPVSGAWDGGFVASIPSVIYGIAVGPEGVYAAMGGGHGGRIWALTSSGGLRWLQYTDGDVQATTYLNGVVYYGGHFDNVCATANQQTNGACVGGKSSRVKLAAASAANGALMSWNPSANGVHGVETMTAQPSMSKLVAGGEFTTIGGSWWPRFIQFG